jgi:sulfur-oxidizing protein SoxA
MAGEIDVRPVIQFVSAALALAALAFGGVPPAAAADKPDPVADAKAFRDYFTKKFPQVKLEDFVNGPYSMNEDMHRQWEEKEQFPPYEFALDVGKEMFTKPFKNGRSYADCFANQGIGVRQNYPTFDEKEGKVVTLALNRCREANGEPPFSYVKDEMAALTAYMAFTSRGKPFDIKIPDDPRALEAYQNGKRYFYTRRGQLNFSCATCHVQEPGERIRAEVLAPGLGILNAMPIYRKPTNTAISNIICPMSAMDCRFPVRGRGHEHDPEKHALGPRPDGWEPVFPRDKRGTRLRGDHARKKKQTHAGIDHIAIVIVPGRRCNFGFGRRLGI